MGNPATRTETFVIHIVLFFTLHCIQDLNLFSRDGDDEGSCLGAGGVFPECIVSSVPAGSFGETVLKVGWSEDHTLNKLSQTGRRRRRAVCPCECN